MRTLLAVGAALLVASSAFGAEGVQGDLEQGLKKLSALKYKDAIKFFEKAVKNPTATRAQRARALEGLGECYIATNRPADAESAYSRLLQENPRADLRPGVSPKLHDFFLDVKKKRFPPDMIELRQESQGPDGGIVVRLVDPWRKSARVVRVSRTGKGEWTRIIVPSSDGSTYRVTPPAPAEEQGEWFVEAQGTDGVAVATVGTATTPFVVKGTKPAPVDVVGVDTPTAPKNPWSTAPQPVPVVTAPAPEPAPAPASKGNGLVIALVAIGAVLVAGAAVAGGYALSQRPSGQTDITLSTKQ